MLSLILLAERNCCNASKREITSNSAFRLRDFLWRVKYPSLGTYVYILVMSGHSGRCPEKRGSKGLSPLFSGHPWPFLALWRKKSPKFVAIIDNRLVPMYEFLRCFYVASLNPSIIDTIFGTLSPGRAKRRARASPRIDLILPPEKVWQKKTMMSKIPPYTRSLQQQWNADPEAMLRFVLLSLLTNPQMVYYYY